MRITIDLETGNAAFEDPCELQRVLASVHPKVVAQLSDMSDTHARTKAEVSPRLRDINGNTVGNVRVASEGPTLLSLLQEVLELVCNKRLYDNKTQADVRILVHRLLKMTPIKYKVTFSFTKPGSEYFEGTAFSNSAPPQATVVEFVGDDLEEVAVIAERKIYGPRPGEEPTEKEAGLEFPERPQGESININIEIQE